MLWQLLLVFFTLAYTEDIQPEGHLKPLGQQRPPEGHIEIIERIPSADEFFDLYIKGSKPTVFKGLANNIPAYNLWKDDYLMKKFGDVTVDVEEGKKENRSLGMWEWSLKKFLKRYQEEDVYMVNSLPKEMRGDLRLFPFLSCGGYTNVLSDVIMWFSSGGTKSVLHNDHIDNVNCLFSGTKTMYMVDYLDRKHITIDASEGAYSLVDVDAVDLKKYPGLAEAPWWQANMEAGDCIFIPSRWYHQVRSYATEKRNMAVNIWFYHMRKINETDCKENESTEFLPLDRYEFSKDKSIFKDAVKFILSLDVADRPLKLKQMARVLLEHNGENIEKGYMLQVLSLLDKDQDKKISLSDIEQLEGDDFKFLKYIFPGIASERGEDEDEGEFDEEDLYGEDENNGRNGETVDNMKDDEIVDDRQTTKTEL